MPRRRLISGLVVCVALNLVCAGLAIATEPPFLYTAAKQYDPLVWMRGAERFPSGATIWVRDATGKRALVPEFVASADPSVSFDGQRVLFAGKRKAQDPWQIWEMLVAGGAPRLVTSGSENCVRPLYLPGDRVVYARRSGGRFVIEVADLAGGKPLALTYGPGSFLPTDVLRDGRILFEASYPLGAGATPELYTVYSDGSGVESYRCDHGNTRRDGKQVSSGDIVFVSGTGVSGTGAVRTRLFRTGLAKFTSALARQIVLTAPAGEYAGEITEMPSGAWLMPWRADGKSPFELTRWKPGTRALRTVVAERGTNILQPTLLAERVIPKRHPSGLHDWPNANLLCLNAYTSKYPFAPGSIRSLRVYTRDDLGHAKLLGTAPVEYDGSFFVQVPTEQPLQIELLDTSGKTLKRQLGFFWMRRGEQRACVGCHAGPETAPENAVPTILLKSTTPADVTGGAAKTAPGGD